MTPPAGWAFGSSQLAQGEDLRAEQDSSIFVHSQDRDCGPARRSSTHDQGPAQLEVIRPILGSRVKQALDLASIGVNSRQICSLERVAPLAGEGKIRRIVRTAMFSRKDMLNVKRHVRLCRLWEPTVFAAMSGSVTDKIA